MSQEVAAGLVRLATRGEGIFQSLQLLTIPEPQPAAISVIPLVS